MKKSDFLTAYRAELVERYVWAKDASHLERFMANVTNVVNNAGTKDKWEHDGFAAAAAWRKIGCKGKITLRAIRALE